MNAVAQPTEWQARAEQALQRELAQRHPHVTTWQLTALADTRQQHRLAGRSVVRADVARTGKRSAVHLWCESTSRPCATVWFAVSGWQTVLGSVRDIPPLHPVRLADFVSQPHDVLNLRCEPLLSHESLVGLRTARALAAGAAVCRDSLEPRPAVSRGESVEVRVAAGAVAITTRAIAQQDAALGQRVRLKRTASAAPILGIVTGAAQVSIAEMSEVSP